MEDETFLIKYDGSENLDKIRYLFFQNVSSKNWIDKYRIRCLINNEPFIEQGNLSDYEYFLKTHPLNYDGTKETYYLVVNSMPVTSVVTHLEDSHFVDISFTTAKKYCGHGYATKAVYLVEKELMQNENILGIKMVDMSINNETSKIAQKLGYNYDSEMNWYYKDNPNYKNTIKR